MTTGLVNDANGHCLHGPPGDVDVVDGLLLAISPRAYALLSFDQRDLPGFHGYDTDYCLQARQARLRVIVVELAYQHHDKGNYGDERAFHDAQNHLRQRWSRWIRPLTPWERGRQRLGRLRRRLLTAWGAVVGLG